MPELISIIIPCYNQKSYVKECVLSVLNNDYDNIEIIIVNDGSTDTSEDVIFDLLKEYNKISYYKIQNSGLSFARNYGFSKSKGKFIAFLDADDILENGFFNEAIIKLEKSNTAFVTCYVRLFGRENRVVDSAKEGGIENYLLYNNNVVFALIKREVFIEVNGFDNSMKKGFEDWDLWLRILSLGYIMSTVKKVCFNYRIKNSSMLVEANENRAELLKYMIKKNDVFLSQYFVEMIILRELEIYKLKNKMSTCRDSIFKFWKRKLVKLLY
jgi:glycosyltransferase involved in cell wall biosynthesis